VVAVLVGSLALYALLRWGRLPLATPGYQGLPLMALLAWGHGRGAGRIATPAAALLAAGALWLSGPFVAAKALALPLVALAYAGLAGPASAPGWRRCAAGAVYALWALIVGGAKWHAAGQGLFALLSAHAGFGLVGAGLAVGLRRLRTCSRSAALE